MAPITAPEKFPLVFTPPKAKHLLYTFPTSLLLLLLVFLTYSTFSPTPPSTIDLVILLAGIFFIIAITTYFISITLSRKIIFTQTQIIDHWGPLHRSQIYHRDTIVDCHLEKEKYQQTHFNFDYSPEGRSLVLVLEGKAHQEIGKINIGNFTRQTQGQIITLINKKYSHHSPRTLTFDVISASS